MLKDLLENDFVEKHGVHKWQEAEIVVAPVGRFDLDDMDSSFSYLDEGAGKVTFENNVHGCIEVAAYERFINNCTKPKSFQQGRKRCDYIMAHTACSGYVVLVELTSAIGEETVLEKPVIGYPKGKNEKCEYQLGNSLSDLLSVPAINSFFMEKDKCHRICLMAYKVVHRTDSDYYLKHPYARYLAIESKATGAAGAIVPCPLIESQGFEYRRISHEHVFVLK